MVTTKKNDQVENETAISEEPQEVEAQQEEISDRRMLLGPLVMYGVIAFFIASIIVTTAIMLNNDNEIDEQVAAVEAEIALQNQAEQLALQEASKQQENTEEVNVQATDVIASNDDTNFETTPPAVTQPVVAAPVVVAPAAVAPVAKAPAVTTPATMTSQDTFKAFDPKARIAERHEFMAKQDEKHLESFKASQAKQIEWLRAQLVRQQQRIEAIEKRNLKTYQMREAAVKRMQEAREQSLNRI